MSESATWAGTDDPAVPGVESGWADVRRNAMELLRVVLLRRWFFLVPACVTFVAALLYSHRLPRQYRASTVIERRYDVPIAKMTLEGVPQKFESVLRSFDFDIIDRDALGEAADVGGLTDGSDGNGQGELGAGGRKARHNAAAQLAAGLDYEFVSRRQDQDLIRLSFIGPDAEQARALVEAVRDVYIRRTQVRILALLEDARAFIEERLSESRSRVESANEELLRLQVAYPGIDPMGADAIAPRTAVLETEQEELNRRHAEIEAEIAARQAFLNNEPLPDSAERTAEKETDELVPNPRREDLRGQIRKIETRITELQTGRHMTDLHPEILSLRSGMRAAAAALAAEPERITREEALAIQRQAESPPDSANPVGEQIREAERDRAQMELASLNSAKARVEADLARMQRELRSLDRLRDEMVVKRREYLALQQEADRVASQYSVWRDRLEEIEQIVEAESVDGGLGLSVVMPATPASRPVSPRFATVLLVSLLLAVGVGVAIVLLCELLDHKYRTVSQVMRHTGLPMLEAIGEIITAAERRRRRIRDLVLKPALAVVLAAACVASAWALHASIEDPARWERIRAALVRSDERPTNGAENPGTA